MKSIVDVAASDTFSLGAMIFDEAVDEVPIAGKLNKLAKIGKKAGQRFLRKKAHQRTVRN